MNERSEYYFGVDAPRVTGEEAAFLCSYFAKLAQTYYEAADDQQLLVLIADASPPVQDFIKALIQHYKEME